MANDRIRYSKFETVVRKLLPTVLEVAADSDPTAEYKTRQDFYDAAQRCRREGSVNSVQRAGEVTGDAAYYGSGPPTIEYNDEDEDDCEAVEDQFYNSAFSFVTSGCTALAKSGIELDKRSLVIAINDFKIAIQESIALAEENAADAREEIQPDRSWTQAKANELSEKVVRLKTVLAELQGTKW